MTHKELQKLHQDTLNIIGGIFRIVVTEKLNQGNRSNPTIQDISLLLRHPELNIYDEYWQKLTRNYPSETEVNYSSEGYIVLYLGNNHRHCIPLQLPDT